MSIEKCLLLRYWTIISVKKHYQSKILWKIKLRSSRNVIKEKEGTIEQLINHGCLSPLRGWWALSVYPTVQTLSNKARWRYIHLQVIYGGGRAKFIPISSKDDEGNPGERADGVDLIKEWLLDKTNKTNRRAKYIQTRDQLLGLDTKNTDYVLGKVMHAVRDTYARILNNYQTSAWT